MEVLSELFHYTKIVVVVVVVVVLQMSSLYTYSLSI
jgi:hypothetical protein